MTNKKLIQNKIKKKDIAIVGAGISGLSCAMLLSEKFNVSLYESNDYLGGHACTLTSNIKSKENKNVFFNYDVGFLVYNLQNYPCFSALIKYLKVKTIGSEMSFSVVNKNTTFEYGSTGILALTNNFKNLLSKKYWVMLFDIFKFYRIAKKELHMKTLKTISVKDFLVKYDFKDPFINDHFLPMCGAIWSTSINKVFEMPIIFIINFFNNHGLLNLIIRPKWRTIANGSKNYVRAIEKKLKGPIYKNEKVTKIYRNKKKVKVESKNFNKVYDKIIFAVHTDEILNLIDSPTKLEKDLFSMLPYEKNKVYVHQDEKLMPNNKKVWSAWNALIFTNNKNKQNSSNNPVCVTYWINKLQKIKTKDPLLITLNPRKGYLPKKEKTIRVLGFKHPLFNLRALKLRPQIKSLQGKNNTFYIGAWAGNGFHEDGLKSAIDIANYFDIEFSYENK